MEHNVLNDIVAKAVKELQEAHVPDRDCVIHNKLARVLLHGETCVEVDQADKTITLFGTNRATRKTVRLLNTILSHFTSQRVMTRTGTWYVINQDNVWTQFSGRQITIQYQ